MDDAWAVRLLCAGLHARRNAAVFLSPVTVQPDQKWVNQQARNVLLEIGDDTKGAVLIHDRDTKFQPSFDGILAAEGMSTKTLPVRSPDLNAHVERFVWSIKHEALNHFVFLGLRHVQHVVGLYARHYNTKRSHSARDNLPPAIMSGQPEEVDVLGPRDVVRHEELGGLLVSFERKAA